MWPSLLLSRGRDTIQLHVRPCFKRRPLRRDDDGRSGTPRGPVVDRLDVVSIWVENVSRVVARVVRALAGSAVVLASGRDRGGVEAPHRFLVLGLERDVETLGRRPVVAPEGLVRPEV